MTTIINFFAGPGAGKSTLAAGLFYEMKMRGKNVELVTEFAKDLVWEERHKTIMNQPYIFGKQYNRIMRLIDKVDYIITDSPLLMLCLYASENCPASFINSVIDISETFDNINYFVERVKPYEHIGRIQTFEEAKIIDGRILKLLEANVDYDNIPGSAEGLRILVDNFS